MNVVTLIFGLLIEYCEWPTAFGSLVSSPMNTVAVVGETIQLNCSTDETYSVNWQHVPIDSTFYEDVYISQIVVLPYYPRYKVNRNVIGNNVFEYNLVISSVQLKDAGKYRCLDKAGHGQQSSAQLTVLESSPICQTNIRSDGFVGDNDCNEDPEKIHCSCSVNFLGNIPPDMQWSSSNGLLIDPVALTNSYTKSTVSSELMVNAIPVLSGTSLVWLSVQSTHINWSSGEIKILYVKNSSSTLVVDRSVLVTCMTYSSVQCNYMWTAWLLPNNDIVKLEGPNLTATVAGTYVCEATCLLSNKTCTLTPLVVLLDSTVTGRDNSEDQKWMIILGVALPLVGLILTAVIFVSVFLTRKMQKRKIPEDNKTCGRTFGEEEKGALIYVAPCKKPERSDI